jgi:hypothetical protein
LEGDDMLTSEMREALHTGQVFSPEMRSSFYASIAASIAEKRSTFPHLVVSQAFAKQHHRERIMALFPDAIFAQVVASRDVQHTRLTVRGDWITPELADKIKGAHVWCCMVLRHTFCVNGYQHEPLNRHFRGTSGRLPHHSERSVRGTRSTWA